ncbi:MAG: hypothetical protein IKO80_04010 [Lachnospiraceae bacterium]|nr:hypothetical protein [Lachnospiraceae bacterium]
MIRGTLKKIRILAAGLVLLIPLTACAQMEIMMPYEREQSYTDTEEWADEPADTDPVIFNDDLEPYEETLPEEEEPVEEEPEEIPEEPEVEKPRVFMPGAVDGDTYENQTLGIGLKLDSWWTYATADEIKKTNGFKEDMTTESVTAFLEEPEEFIDMDVVSGGIGNEISISAINSTFIAGNDLSAVAGDTAAALEEQLSKEKGYEDISSEVVQVNFLGEELSAALVTCSYQGTRVSQMQIHNIRNGYFYTISLLVFGEDDPESLFGNFYEIQGETT